jgi:hypothetical protein
VATFTAAREVRIAALYSCARSLALMLVSVVPFFYNLNSLASGHYLRRDYRSKQRKARAWLPEAMLFPAADPNAPKDPSVRSRSSPYSRSHGLRSLPGRDRRGALAGVNENVVHPN